MNTNTTFEQKIVIADAILYAVTNPNKQVAFITRNIKTVRYEFDAIVNLINRFKALRDYTLKVNQSLKIISFDNNTQISCIAFETSCIYIEILIWHL